MGVREADCINGVEQVEQMVERALTTIEVAVIARQRLIY